MHCRKVRAWLVLMLALITGTALAQQPQHDEHYPPAPPAAQARGCQAEWPAPATCR